MRRSIVAAVVVLAAVVIAPAAGARVLRVGSYKGIPGQYHSIQAAVNAAGPGDWILVGPGDYKERADHRANRGPQAANTPAGVVISTPRVYLRGMNRNTVVVDGTKPGTPKCSSKAAAQDFGPNGSDGKPLGRNGVLVWKANDVWVQNLTICNFLGGTGSAGNEVWWNGGDGSAKIGGYGFLGSYLNATSTYYDASNPATAAQYGIFSSNWNGGVWDQTYASNFNDSSYYIGACQQVCNQTVNHAHAQFSALGYSGSNSGGRLVIKNSEFDQNKDGFDTNSQNGDNPPPQNGACPDNGISAITHTHSCWVFMHNYLHDNNNPNVPALGSAAQGPVGTGMSISGARNDTIMGNRFVNNKAWGLVVVPYTDSGPPCTGGTLNSPLLGTGSCLFDDYGNAVLNNRFSNNGGYGNPTNGDFDQLNLESHPTNCFAGNTDSKGSLNTESAKLQQAYPTCNGQTVSPNINIPFLNEVLCDSQVMLTGFGCQTGDNYPRRTGVVMQPLPKDLKTMPNPCADVPANPWCPGRKGHRHGQRV
jgi:hypothetical protein